MRTCPRATFGAFSATSEGEVRSQKSEVRGRKTEASGQKPADRSQRTEASSTTQPPQQLNFRPPLLLFRRKRRHNFFEARVAAKRIPLRVELEFAVSDASWNFRRDGELFERQVLLASPGIDRGEIDDVGRAVHCVLGDWQQFTRAAPFADRIFLASKAGIDESESTPGRRVIGLVADGPFFDNASGGEGRSCFGFIAEGACGKANKPVPRPD